MTKAYPGMPEPVRRVVTFHDEKGDSVVWQDHEVDAVRVCPPDTPADARTVRVTELWHSDSVPADNGSTVDIAHEISKAGALRCLHLAEGVVFRAVDFPPGGDKAHRTQSVDFAVVISGEICMELEPGNEVRLCAGDSLVQRGTVHKWVNRTDQYARVIFVLVGAKQHEIDGVKVKDAEYGINE